jgi:hypothetical protein
VLVHYAAIRRTITCILEGRLNSMQSFSNLLEKSHKGIKRGVLQRINLIQDKYLVCNEMGGLSDRIDLASCMSCAYTYACLAHRPKHTCGILARATKREVSYDIRIHVIYKVHNS